jgi:hypothetical protein
MFVGNAIDREKCVFKSYYMPILANGTEILTWTKRDIRLTAAVIRFLKSIKKPEKGRIRNENLSLCFCGPWPLFQFLNPVRSQ